MGHAITEQVDVYAFGVLLVELFAGVKPIQAETVERIFYFILNEPLNLEPLRQSGAPQAIVDLVAEGDRRFVAHLGGVVMRRGLHCHQRQELEHMVLHHVAQRTRVVLEVAPAL